MKLTPSDVLKFVKNSSNQYKAQFPLDQAHPLNVANAHNSIGREYFAKHSIRDNSFSTYPEWDQNSHVYVSGYYPYTLGDSFCICLYADPDVSVIKNTILQTLADYSEVPVELVPEMFSSKTGTYYTGRIYKLDTDENGEGGIYSLFESDGEWSLIHSFYRSTYCIQTYTDLDQALADCVSRFGCDYSWRRK